MRLRTIALAAVIGMAPLSTEASAQTATPTASEAERPVIEQRATQIIAFLRSEIAAEEIFAPLFLAEIPPRKLAALREQMLAQYGPVIGLAEVETLNPQQANLKIEFERGAMTGLLVLAEDGYQKIIGLQFTPGAAANDTVASITEELNDLPGEVSVLLTPLAAGAAPNFALAPERQMAIGSAFKLYVLSALARSIEAGERQWADVAPLSVRSPGSGPMQSWLAGSPVTLQTLATMMISASDNTATDALIGIIGKDAIEAEINASGHSAPERMLPFLTTLEVTAMKGDAALAQQFISADEAEQATLVSDLGRRLGGDPAKVNLRARADPHAIRTIEWFASSGDIAEIVRRFTQLGDDTALQILAVNPALSTAAKEGWSYAGFKGGSEPGVLNLSWLLRDADGTWSTLTMSWNDEAAPVDTDRFVNLAYRLLALSRN